MKSLQEMANDTVQKSASGPQGQVLKGQYQGGFRSEKGKLKGLMLQVGATVHTVQLPKYLRPMLVRELTPGDFIQVWAYPEGPGWRAINILSLPETEVQLLQQTFGVALPSQSEVTVRPCIQVCRKGKCFRQGSSQLWQALQAEIESNPDWQHISLEATGCMKACKQGPNLRVLPAGQMLHHVSPGQASAVLTNFS